MSQSFDSIRSPFRNLDPTSALEQPTSILLGISQSAANALGDVGISTVFDLATSEVFANAVDICLLAQDGQGRFAATGKVPHDVLREGHDKPITDLPLQPISILSTHSTKTKLDALAVAIDIASVRDLAAWPPYCTARELLDRVYNPLAINGVLDQEAPADLIPATGQYPTERVQYEVLLFDAFVGGRISHPKGPYVPDYDPQATHGPVTDRVVTNRLADSLVVSRPAIDSLAASRPAIDSLAASRPAIGGLAADSLCTLRPLGSDGPLDISKLLSVDEGYHLPAIGGVLTFTQSWYTKGLSLGNLIHSVALAPGESTKIAMIDWSRRTRTSATEAISEDELLDSNLLRSRAINEITSAVAKETQQGNSGASNTAESKQSGTSGGGAKLDDLSQSELDITRGIKSPGVSIFGTSSGESIGTTDATSWSTTSGERNVGAELSQDIVDRTHQASHSVRNRRASIVREVSQTESEKITTRTITNYNHMHALTVEYFEVVQLYRTVVELSKADRCVFVPMKLVDFSIPQVIERYRQVIAASGLRGDVRLLSVAAYDHFALFAPLRGGPWNQASLFNARKWLGTNVGAPTDTVFSFPSSFVFSDVYFDKKTPFDTLVVTLASGEIVTLPLAVEEVVDTTPAAPDDSSLLPTAPRKATALSVCASYHFTSETMPVEFSLDNIQDDLKIVVGESTISIDSVKRFYDTESNRFNILTKEGIDVPIDAGTSIGLTWAMGHYRSSSTTEQLTSMLKFDDVRFEAKIGGKWVPIASASSLEVQWNGRGTTTISPAVTVTAPTSSLQVPTTETMPLVGTLHIKVENDAQSRKVAKKLFDERLHEVRSIAARKKDDAADFAGSISVGLFSDFDDRSVRPLSWSINVPKDSTSVVLFEIQPTATTNELIDHLMSNQLYYSQVVWRALNPTTIGILLSRYTWHIGNQERPLVELVDPTPAAIVANYLVLRLSGDDAKEHATWLAKKKIIIGSRREDLVPVPSGGVFAEAVLGRFNSAEKLDITRFWNWQDSPIPIQAPDIAAIQAGSRREADTTTPGQLGAPMLNIVNPPALPDPQGMGAVLAAIQNGNMFRDMSGLAATIGLAQAGLTGAQQGASDASTQAGKNAEVAAQLGAKIAETVAKLVASYFNGGASLAGGGGSGQDGMINQEKGISKTGSMLNYARGMDDREVPSQGSTGDGTAPSSSPGTGGGGGEPTDGSGVGSIGYAASSAPSVGNERAVFKAAYGGLPLLASADAGFVPDAGSPGANPADAGTGIGVSIAGTATRVVDPNEAVVFIASVQPAGGTVSWSGGGVPATGTGTSFTTRFPMSGLYQITASVSGDAGAGATTSVTVHVRELSGAAWVDRFPQSTSTTDLAQPFRVNVEAFIAALTAAGASPVINTTFRPRERAYLMHYAPAIADGTVAPNAVPSESGVGIGWQHRQADGTPDIAASRAAAQQMATGYNVSYPAAFPSHHSDHLAIDMTINWTGDITVNDNKGNPVVINTQPRTGGSGAFPAGNAQLNAVGATYGVIKLVGDAPHWSDNGH